jgi:hypothetical protein
MGGSLAPSGPGLRPVSYREGEAVAVLGHHRRLVRGKATTDLAKVKLYLDFFVFVRTVPTDG